MPKYLAIDHLTSVKEVTRSLLERMLLPSPQHLEFVNPYTHKGECPDSAFLTPWTIESLTDKPWQFLEGDFPSELQRLLSTVSTVRQGVEDFKEDWNNTSVSSIDLFDLLVDEEIDCNKETVEEFIPYNLHPQYALYGDHVSELIECPESPLHLSLLVNDIPSAHSLSQRLNPKPVADPFLNTQGNSVSLRPEMIKTDSLYPCLLPGEYKEAFVQFPDTENILEAPLSPNEDDIASCCHVISKGLECEDIEGNIEEEMRRLGSGRDTTLPLAQFDTNGNCPHKPVFTDVNTIGLDDSGVSTLLLESPCGMEMSPPTSLEALSQLEMYPISPDKNRLELLSSAEERSLMAKLFRQDSSFDNVASMKFQYPKVSELTDCTPGTVSEVVNMMELSLESLTGEFELCLSWDPVACLIHHIKSALISLRPDPVTCAGVTNDTEEEEMFVMTDLKELLPDDSDVILDMARLNMSQNSKRVLPKPMMSHKDRVLTARDTYIDVGGLDSFMFMRSCPVVQDRPTTSSIEPINVSDTNNEMERLQSVEPLIVDVQLTDDYMKLLEVIVQCSVVHIKSLSQYWSLGKDFLSSLNSCILFIMEDKIVNSRCFENFEEGSVANRSLLILHLISGVTRAIMRGSFNAGLSTLTEAIVRYGALVSDELTTLKDNLSKINCTSEAGWCHPKLNEILKILEEMNGQERALIVLNDDHQGIAKDIVQMLQVTMGLEVCCIQNEGGRLNETHRVESKLMLYQCVVVPLCVALVLSSSIWRLVSIVIDYDSTHSHMSIPGVEYIRLCSVMKSEDGNQSNQQCLLVSKIVTENSELVEMLESKYDRVVVEADFNEEDSNNRPSNLFIADIAIDAQTCVLIRPIRSLGSQDGVRQLVNTVSMLSPRYKMCWVLLHSTNDMYTFEGSVPVNLGCLHASVSHFNSNDFIVQVSCCFNAHDIADKVMKIIEHRGVANHEIPMNGTAKHYSKAVKFLLSLKCFNPLSAYCLLRGRSLRSLLLTPLSEMKELFPLVPEKSLQVFKQLCALGKLTDNTMDIVTDDTRVSPDKECSSSIKRVTFNLFDHDQPLNKRPRTSNATIRNPLRANSLGYDSSGIASLSKNDRVLCTEHYQDDFSASLSNLQESYNLF